MESQDCGREFRRAIMLLAAGFSIGFTACAVLAWLFLPRAGVGTGVVTAIAVELAAWGCKLLFCEG